MADFGRLILASASERRKNLLQSLGISFEIYASSLEEPEPEPKEKPENFVTRASFFKSAQVIDAIGDPEAWILSADTVVVLEDKILGKPKSKEEAKHMLVSLSGRKHLVYTGYTIIQQEKEVAFQEAVCTEVFFRHLSSDKIERYIQTGEPMDKAGSYGIQGKGAIFVESIEGCFFNVVGLPIGHVVAALERFGAGHLF